MGKNKNKKKSKIYQIGFSNIEEVNKYVMPVDVFDVQFLQQNYYKSKVRYNDNVVPIWDVQWNSLDTNYYEFEVIAGRDEKSLSYGITDSAGETATQLSTDSKNINTVIKLNDTDEEIDFTTYMKLVNVFNESEKEIASSAADQCSLKDQQPSNTIVDHKNTAKNEAFDSDSVILCVSSGEKVEVSMSNFHGICSSGDGVQCRVCMVIVNNVKAHKMEIRHMKKIASTINNVHCIRKIGPILNHCVLCNEIIENIEFHIKTDAAHTKFLETALKLKVPEITYTNIKKSTNNPSAVDKSAVQKENSPTDIAYCNVCDRKMHISTLESHEKGKNHKAMLDKEKEDPLAKLRYEYQQIAKSDLIRKPEITNDNANHPFNNPTNIAVNKLVMETAKSPIDIHVKKADIQHKPTLTNHIILATNKQYHENIGICNSTSNKSNGFSFCNVCNKKMQSVQLKAHIEGKHHKAQLLMIKSKEIKEVDKNIHLPSVSGIEVKKINQNQTKESSVSHKTIKDKEVKNVASDCTYNQFLAFENDKSASNAYCKICNMKMHINNLKSHEEGKYHKDNLDRYIKRQENAYNKQVNANKIGPISVLESFHDKFQMNLLNNSNGDRYDDVLLNSLIETLSKLRPDDNKSNADKVNNVNIYYCDVCDVGVPNNPLNIKEHVSGLMHKKNIDRIIVNHNISLKINNTYYCNMCKMYFSKASVMKHVNSDKHKSLLAK